MDELFFTLQMTDLIWSLAVQMNLPTVIYFDPTRSPTLCWDYLRPQSGLARRRWRRYSFDALQ